MGDRCPNCNSHDTIAVAVMRIEPTDDDPSVPLAAGIWCRGCEYFTEMDEGA